MVGIRSGLLLVGGGLFLAEPVAAQPAAPDAEVAPPVSADAGAEPAPPVFEAPPMPADSEDFSVDADHFQEVETAPERNRERAEAEEQALAGTGPLYERHAGLVVLSQAVAGVFGSGLLALLGGSIGSAIDSKEKDFTRSTPLTVGTGVGAGIGSLIGATLGVWSAARLFEKPTSPWLTGVGALAGTAIGGGIATGLLLGTDGGDTVATVAVGAVLALQVGGAILLGDALMDAPPAEPVPVALPGAPRDAIWFPVVNTRF